MIKVEKKSMKVGSFVNKNHVDKVIRTYKKERWVHNSNRIGKEDSLSAWFSIEEIEEFIAMCKNHNADGIKFYFAAYPEDFAPKPEYAGRQTIVMVATKAKETEDGSMNKDVYYEKDGASEILAYNVGNLCPPICGGPNLNGETGIGSLGATIIQKGDNGFFVI
ncbi:MAG TPA: hypothetical protein VMT76_10960 [Puia sp.]|nr:hypothetical protein [Puia sp.]